MREEAIHVTNNTHNTHTKHIQIFATSTSLILDNVESKIYVSVRIRLANTKLRVNCNFSLNNITVI